MLDVSNILPVRWQPVAKAIIAAAIPLIALIYSQAFLSAPTSTKITLVVVSIATSLGVYKATNPAIDVSGKRIK